MLSVEEQLAEVLVRLKKVEDQLGVTEANESRKLREDIIQVCLDYQLPYSRAKRLGREFFNDGFTPVEVEGILVKRGATKNAS